MKNNKLILWMISLILLSGIVNVLSICFFATTVSHVTGLLSYFTISFMSGDYSRLSVIALTILSYLSGSIISGVITERREYSTKRRYGFIVSLIGVILFAGFHSISLRDIKIAYLLALVMGMQNGMILNFKGIIVRLTHMTGNLTDLGVHIGFMLKGDIKGNLLQVMLPLISILVFISGGIIGIILYENFKFGAFDIVSIGYLVLGVSYLAVYYYRRKFLSLNINRI